MASAEETVDLFDKSTWGDVEYDDLVEVFHKKVAIHCCNSQRTESFVLASAIISRTNVEEVRRSCRGITQSSVMRPFLITKRDIDLPKELKDMTWNEKKDQLRIDEMQVKVAKDLAFSIEHWSKVTAIEPQSEKMMELFPWQREWKMKKRKK